MIDFSCTEGRCETKKLSQSVTSVSTWLTLKVNNTQSSGSIETVRLSVVIACVLQANRRTSCSAESLIAQHLIEMHHHVRVKILNQICPSLRQTLGMPTPRWTWWLKFYWNSDIQTPHKTVAVCSLSLCFAGEAAKIFPCRCLLNVNKASSPPQIYH